MYANKVVVGVLGQAEEFFHLPAVAHHSPVLWRKIGLLLFVAGLLHDMAGVSINRWPACLYLWLPDSLL